MPLLSTPERSWQVVEVRHTDGDVAAGAAVTRLYVGDAATDEDLAAAVGEPDQAARGQRIATHRDGAQRVAGVHGEERVAVEGEVGQRVAAGAAEIEGLQHLARIDVDRRHAAAGGDIGDAVAQSDSPGRSRERDVLDQRRRGWVRDVDDVQARRIAGDHGYAARGIDRHVGVGAGQIELGQNRGLCEFRGINKRQTIVTGCNIGCKSRCVLDRSSDGDSLSLAR